MRKEVIIPAWLDTTSFMAAILLITCVSGNAQQVSTQSLNAGSRSIEGTTTAGAVGMALHLNDAPSRIESVEVSEGKFCFYLAAPLKVGDTVQVRQFVDGAWEPWTDAEVVGSGASRELLPKVEVSKASGNGVQGAAAPATTPEASSPANTSGNANSAPASSTGSDTGKNTLFTRSTVGVTMAAANGATPTARLFVDFYLTAPLFGLHKSSLNSQFKDPLDTRVWAFFNPRLTSVSQSNIAIGSAVSTSSTIFQNAGTTDLTKLVQTFEMEQGLEFRLIRSGPWMPDTIGAPKDGSSGSRLGLFAFGSYGVGVPITGQQTVSNVYLGNPPLDALYGAPSGTQYIGVVENTKDRFYRNFFVGLRLKTFNYDIKKCETDSQQNVNNKNSEGTGLCSRVRDEFPGTYEVAWGQDDSVNGQLLTGGVVRIRGFYPLPFYPALHLFGGVELSLKQKAFINNTQFVLAPSNITPTSAGVFQVGVNPPARDQYQFGIGLDLIEVVKEYKKSQSAKQQMQQQNQKQQQQISDQQKTIGNLQQPQKQQ